MLSIVLTQQFAQLNTLAPSASNYVLLTSAPKLPLILFFLKLGRELPTTLAAPLSLE